MLGPQEEALLGGGALWEQMRSRWRKCVSLGWALRSLTVKLYPVAHSLFLLPAD